MDAALESHQGHLSREFLPFPFHAKSKVVCRAGGTSATRTRFLRAESKTTRLPRPMTGQILPILGELEVLRKQGTQVR
jgi:hypothetical protein